jgi:hypothetical protein
MVKLVTNSLAAQSIEPVERQSVETAPPEPVSAPPAPDPEPPAPAVPQQPLTPLPDPALPNPNVPAARSYYNETQIKLASVSQKLMLLENEMEAIEAKFVADVDDLTARRNAQLADLQKQVDDHKLAKAMATAPIAIYEEAQQT